VSTEYYTGVGYDKAKAKLIAANTGEFSFEVSEQRRFSLEGREFLLRHVKSGGALWGYSEIRDPKKRPILMTGVLPPLGTLVFERFGGNRVWRYLPWVEKVLGVLVMSEVGLPWQLDQ